MESGLKTYVKPWPLFGYAPGGYMSKCSVCGETFDGDKRAFNCLPCAAIQAKNALPPSSAPLLEALEWAIRQLDEWDAYQKRPDSGGWGVECACCMGEMFDADDRARLNAARAALAAAKVQEKTDA